MSIRMRLVLCVVVVAYSSGFAGRAIAGGDDGASLASAHGFLKRGLYDMAEKEYRRVLAESPGEVETKQARYGLAVCLLRQGKYAESGSLLGSLYDDESFEFSADVAVMLAQCMSALGKYESAARIVADSRGRLAGHALADDAAAIGIEALYRDGKYRVCLLNAEAFLKAYKESNLAALIRAYGGLSAAQVNEDEKAVTLSNAALAGGLPDAMAVRVRLTLADALQRTGDLDGAASAYVEVRTTGGELAAKAALGLGAVRWRQGDYDAALSLVNEALKSPSAIGDENVAYAQLIRGRLLLEAGKYSEAESAFEKSAIISEKASFPYADQASYWRAKCFLRDGNAERAAELLRDAIEKHSDSKLVPDMRYDLAVALVRLHKNAEAVEAIKAFVDSHADNAMVPDALKLLVSVTHQMGDYVASDRQITAWRNASKSQEALPAELAFIHAENAYLSGDYKSAARRYAKFLKASSDDTRSGIARRRLGLSQYRVGAFDAAMTTLTALGDGGQTPATIFAIGDMHFTQRDWQQAESWLDRFLASPADSPTDDALLKSGIAHMRLGEYETALRRFKSIVDREGDSPQHTQAVFEMGQALVAMDKLDDAATAFRQVIKMKDGARFVSPAREHLAAIGLRTGRPELAAETFAAMADADTSDDDRSSARLRQAEALIQAEKFSEAATVLNELLDENKSFPERDRAMANRVLALARSNDCEGAIEQFKSLDVDKLASTLSLAVRYDRAWCLRKSGNSDLAAAAFGEIVASAADTTLGRHAALELAVIESERGNRDKAVELLTSLAAAWRAGQLPAGFAVDQVLYRLGKAQFESEQFAPSLETMRSLLEKFPKSKLTGPAAYLGGESAFRLEQFERVAALMAKAIDAGKDTDYHASALLRMGDALNRLQRWSDSENRFGEFLAVHADSPYAYQAHFGIGWARENSGRYADAIESYRRVAERHKGETAARAQFQIGQCLFAMKDYDNAVRELIKTDILYAYPQWSAAGLFEAGRCFERMNRRGEARQQFKTVVEKYGETKWAAPAGERLQALASAGASD